MKFLILKGFYLKKCGSRELGIPTIKWYNKAGKMG